MSSQNEMPDRSYIPFPQADLQPLFQVLEILRLEELSPGVFQGNSLPGPSNRVYGGQVMAQSLTAATATLPADTQRCPHSMHGYFVRMGRIEVPVDFTVSNVYDGKSFSNRSVVASQEGVPIMTLTVSFQEHQPGLEYSAPMPETIDPETLPSNSELVRKFKHPAAWMLLHTGAFDIRHVSGQLYFDNGMAKDGQQMVWIRANHALPDSTPQSVHRALLAYACDQVALEPVLRAVGLQWTTPDLAVASLDHSMWFHRHVDVRDWLLYVQDAPTAQGGRGLGRATIYNRKGELVASMAQEGMVRLPPGAGASTA